MAIDHTLAFLRDPYRFIGRQCFVKNTEAFEARIFFKKSWLLTGIHTRELFLDSANFQHSNNDQHDILRSPEAMKKLNRMFSVWLINRAEKWQREGDIALYDEFNEILTAAACEWIGIRLMNGDLKLRARELSSMTDQMGLGIKQFLSKASGNNAELWLQGLLEDIRMSGHEFKGQKIIDQIAWSKDSHLAARDLLMLLKTIVSQSSTIVFMVHALAEHPEALDSILLKEENYPYFFMSEILRFYPLNPPRLAHARKDFHWRGYHFKKHQPAFFDEYGTNHSPDEWERPFEFNPYRFQNRIMDRSDMLLTYSMMMTALDFFVTAIDYKIPEQNLSLNWNRLPVLPKDGMIINNVVLRKRSRFTERNSSLGNAIFS